MPRHIDVDVCVCTYRRSSLEATLCSLGAQNPATGPSFRVIVADNDDHPSAQMLAQRAAAALGLDLLYVHAPAHNISVARNACLDAATAPLIAFLDDDEAASESWLERMVDSIRQSGADVVFGPVDAIYGEDAPEWTRKADLHSIRPVQYPPGQFETGYSCNVIMRAERLGALRFDPALGRSGGEDTWFFKQLSAQGARLHYCPDALVTERVPPARARLEWLLRRSFRTGQTHARVLAARGRGRWESLVSAAAKVAYCAGKALLTSPFPAPRNRALVRGALHLGVISSLLGKRDLQLY